VGRILRHPVYIVEKIFFVKVIGLKALRVFIKKYLKLVYTYLVYTRKCGRFLFDLLGSPKIIITSTLTGSYENYSTRYNFPSD
jgi:hypothetical protein